MKKTWREKQHIRSIYVRDTDGKDTGCLHVREVKKNRGVVHFVRFVTRSGSKSRGNVALELEDKPWTLHTSHHTWT